MPDVREHIRNSRPNPETLAPLDLDGLEHRARRRTRSTRGATALTVVAVMAAGIVVVGDLGPAGPVVGPGDLASQPGSPATEPEQSGGPTPADSLGDALDELMEANRQADAHPVAGEGEIVVERTYALWGGPNPGASSLEAVWYEQRIDERGVAQIIRAPLGEVASSNDPATLRARASDLFEAGPPETEPLGESHPGSHVGEALDEAERDARGSAQPTDGSTERPDQMYAFMRAADALRIGLQPADRIRALEVIARLDRSIVEYRGVQRDLLGREGIAVAGRDGVGETVRWNVLIFDRDTGQFLGEYDEVVVAGGAPTITSYTARETVVLDTTS